MLFKHDEADCPYFVLYDSLVRSSSKTVSPVYIIKIKV